MFLMVLTATLSLSVTAGVIDQYSAHLPFSTWVKGNILTSTRGPRRWQSPPAEGVSGHILFMPLTHRQSRV